jgi:hypothetical protein
MLEKIAHEENNLLLQPVCTPFPALLCAYPYLRNLIDVLYLLQTAHSRIVFHRDICPRHLLVHEQTGYLIDWDNACFSLEPEAFTGGVMFASPRVLNQLLLDSDALISYTAADDLVSFVQSMYSILNMSSPPVLPAETCKYWEALSQGDDQWASWLLLASHADHDALIGQFKVVIPALQRPSSANQPTSTPSMSPSRRCVRVGDHSCSPYDYEHDQLQRSWCSRSSSCSD